jgi:hypothetical protein
MPSRLGDNAESASLDTRTRDSFNAESCLVTASETRRLPCYLSTKPLGLVRTRIAVPHATFPRKIRHCHFLAWQVSRCPSQVTAIETDTQCRRGHCVSSALIFDKSSCSAVSFGVYGDAGTRGTERIGGLHKWDFERKFKLGAWWAGLTFSVIFWTAIFFLLSALIATS